MNTLVNDILTGSFQQGVGGYWIKFKDCNQSWFKTSTSHLNEQDLDFQNFYQWFENIKIDEENDFVSVISCEPNLESSQNTSKLVSLQGKITSIVDDHGLINDYIYFELKDIQGFGSNVLPTVGDVVHVEAEQKRQDGGWKASLVVPVKEESLWDDDDPDFRLPTSHETKGAMVGMVTEYDAVKKCGSIEHSVTFTANDVSPDFIPFRGDWVQAIVSKGSVAKNIKPIRIKKLTGTVTFVHRDRNGHGTVNDDVYFDLSHCVDNYCPRKSDQVSVKAIESKQGRHCWRASEVVFIGRSKYSSLPAASNKGKDWTLRGDRPQASSLKAASLPSFLPQFSIPETLRTCVRTGGDLLNLFPKVNESPSIENYAVRFSVLLHVEELAIEAEISRFRLPDTSLNRRGEFLVLVVPGLCDGKPSLIVGDAVVLKPVEAGSSAFRSMVHEGYIHHIAMETEELLIKFHDQLHCNFSESDRFDVSFTYSRTPFRRCHLAVKLAKERFVKMLFPPNSSILDPRHGNSRLTEWSDVTEPSISRFFNPCLNDRQKIAVKRMLESGGRTHPYVLFGPPGTGKTVTIVEAILQAASLIPSCRLLICAPSNSAVDLLCERLHDSGLLSCDAMTRFNSHRRPPQAVPERIRQYCATVDGLAVTARYKLVLTTCVNAGQFYSLSLRSDHFTHVFVDEAGQATEPECLIPIGLGAKGRIVLAGDPKQLGAVIKSSYASHFKLGVSLLERLMNNANYSRNMRLFEDGYNPKLVTKLLRNYRSHPSLLTIPSKLFYDNELQPHAPESLATAFCGWEHLPAPNFPSVFHGIVGTQIREETSPSWFNAEEIVQVCRYVKLLLNGKKRSCQSSDIGVITPYRKQVEKLRMMFKALDIVGVKIGSVEEFQGQERKVIVLSTVRSKREQETSDDSSLVTALGFLASPKRFNVAISRAIALLIVVGNPLVLAMDENWKILLKHHIDNDAYTGHDVSSVKELLQP